MEGKEKTMREAAGIKMGRPRKYFPDELEAKFNEYIEDHKKRTWYKTDVIRSGERAGEVVHIPAEPPMSIEGFCIFAGIVKNMFCEYEKKEDFKEVISRIRERIEVNQLEGATVGVFNPNIIARKLGLSDKIDVKNDGTTQQLNISVNGKGLRLSKDDKTTNKK